MDHPAACPNCGQDLSVWPQARHCPNCGQETHLHAPTLWEFVHEFITHYVALEGALWRTLRGLAVPGRLTLEYLAGRRRLYLLPLRLYLSCSFVFFLALKLNATPPEIEVQRTGAESAAVAVDELQTEADELLAACQAPVPASAVASAASRPTEAQCRDAQRLQAVAQGIASAASGAASGGNLANSARVLAWAPYAMFLMQPVFAALLKLLYLDRRRSYGEHFVFSLHLHSAWYLLLLAAMALPGPADMLPLLGLPVYAVLAMRRVHGSPGAGRLAGMVVTSLVYCTLLVAAAVGMAWLAMGSGH